jgi:lysophospholipase L1-like esterase
MTIGRTLATISLLTLSVVVSVATAELILRQLYRLPLPYKSPQIKYDEHAVRRFTLRSDQDAYSVGAKATIGPSGLRRVSGQIENGDSTVTLFALGDSFTFGFGVADSDTWPSRLQEEMNNRQSDGVRVLNGGVISYGVEQELHLFVEKGLPQQPSVVVHALYWNDYMPAGPTGRNVPSALTDSGYLAWDPPPTNSSFGRTRQFFRNNSVLAYFSVNLLRQAFQRDGGGQSSYERAYWDLIGGRISDIDFDAIEEFYSLLGQYGDRAKYCIYGIILPVVDLVETPVGVSHPYELEVEAMYERLDIPYFNAIKHWRELGLRAETFLPYNRHLNAEGYAILASAISEDVFHLVKKCGQEGQSDAVGSASES